MRNVLSNRSKLLKTMHPVQGMHMKFLAHDRFSVDVQENLYQEQRAKFVEQKALHIEKIHPSSRKSPEWVTFDYEPMWNCPDQEFFSGRLEDGIWICGLRRFPTNCHYQFGHHPLR